MASRNLDNPVWQLESQVPSDCVDRDPSICPVLFYLCGLFHGNQDDTKIWLLHKCSRTPPRTSLPGIFSVQVFYLCGKIKLKQGMSQFGEPG